MKNTFFHIVLAGTLGFLTACDGVINISSQSSSRSESSVSENSQTIVNGDTTMHSSDKKSKSKSESENRTRIGFSTDDKTGIADEVRKNLRDRRKNGDTTDTDEDEPVREKKKKSNNNISLKDKVACEGAISGDDFQNAKARFEKVQMDMDRVRKGKQIFNELCITSKQAQELVSALSLENYKLELAKFLYGRTTDKEKFMRVADEFSFDDTRKKLSNYIND
jgi:hypothetical protein